MTIEHERPEFNPSETLERYEKMIQLIKKYPVKKIVIPVISTTGKWEHNAGVPQGTTRLNARKK